ncbi:hypothetical protein GW17_00024436, partial [Ensete ventricosum]
MHPSPVGHPSSALDLVKTLLDEILPRASSALRCHLQRIPSAYALDGEPPLPYVVVCNDSLQLTTLIASLLYPMLFARVPSPPSRRPHSHVVLARASSTPPGCQCPRVATRTPSSLTRRRRRGPPTPAGRRRLRVAIVARGSLPLFLPCEEKDRGD